ncbi:MAG: hypothetical protein JSU87_01490 [Gemmatimonadota bacterium]|nr:MAG: hypothetical protein JSU87_01490 [Gemmatimonadota bacterium]
MAPRPAEHDCRRDLTLQEARSPGAPERRSRNSIRWYGPSDPAMQRELARWCGTVGPAVIESHPAAALASVTSAGPLTVVSWNAAVGSGDPLELLRREFDLTCADGVPRPGTRFSHFALLVQEAHRLSEDVPVPPPDAPFPKQIDPKERPGPMLDVVEVAARCGLALLYVPLSRNGQRAQGERREDKGNAILSSRAISDFFAIELPVEASRKVSLGASVELPEGGRLRVVNVHFDVSAGLARILISGNSWRFEQAAATIEGIELADGALRRAGTSEGSVATLVAGDFNVWTADDAGLKLFHRKYSQSPTWTGKPTRGAFPPDHLFFKEAEDGRVRLVPGSYQRVEERYHSDHHGLRVLVTSRP